MVAIDAPPVEHDVELTTLDRYVDHALGTHAIATAPDWLALDEQKLLEEQAFPGRAASRGDELGAAIVAARLAESVMRLGFYLDRRYAPYGKWFGTAFRRLPCAQQLQEPLARLLVASGLDEREDAWASVLRALLELHELHELLTPGRYAPADVYRGRRGIGIPAFGPASIHELVQELRRPPLARVVPARVVGPRDTCPTQPGDSATLDAFMVFEYVLRHGGGTDSDACRGGRQHDEQFEGEMGGRLQHRGGGHSVHGSCNDMGCGPSES
jgi:hypothetical protein